MLFKIPYSKFCNKLKGLWETCGDQFPPLIIEDSMVYYNSCTCAIINKCEKGEFIEIETENDDLKKILGTEDYILTYGRWFNDDYFSYIVLPRDSFMKQLDLKSVHIPRMNCKSMLSRLGIYGMDYAISSCAHNSENPESLYLYKEHPSYELTNDPNKRIGYVISIGDDEVEVLIDRKYYDKLNISSTNNVYIRFSTEGDKISNTKYSVKNIVRIEVIDRNDGWRLRYTKDIIDTSFKNILPKNLLKYRG